jgi:hypothetical protein
MIPVQGSRDPYSDVQRKLTDAFSVKMPKFDISESLSRMLGNPFKQPQDQIAGKITPVRM